MNGSKTDNKVLLIGIGNSGRGDDALGWLFIDKVMDLVDADVEYRYQLQVEDAAEISKYDVVIFVDASREKLKNGFSFDPCTPVNSFSFTSHRIEPGSILWLSHELYGRSPDAFVMAIEGLQWDLHLGLSVEAGQNFETALSFFKRWLQQNEQLLVMKNLTGSAAS